MDNIRIENEKKAWAFTIMGKQITVGIETAHPPGIEPVPALILELTEVLRCLHGIADQPIGEAPKKEFTLPPPAPNANRSHKGQKVQGS